MRKQGGVAGTDSLKEVEEVGADLWLGLGMGSIVASPSLRIKGLMVSGS